jgi:hypothetical protein
MTSKDDSWIDNLLDDQCSSFQVGIIEQLLTTSGAAIKYKDINLNKLTYDEAEIIIRQLREDDRPRDPREQFYRMFGKGGGIL